MESLPPLPDPLRGPFGKMGGADPLLGVIEAFYAAVEHPERLRDALRALAGLTGAGSVLLLATEGEERRLLAATHGPARLVHPTIPLPVRSDAQRTVPLAGGFELVLERAPSPPRALALVTAVAPHVARALRLADRLAAHGDRHELRAADLDRVPLGVVLLDRAGEVLSLNRAARGLIANCSALELDPPRLRPRAPAARVLLETLVARVVAAPAGGRRPPGGRLHLDDETWRRLDLLVTRCATRLDRQEVHGIVVLSAEGATPSPERRLADLFDLAPEDAELAVELAVGRGTGGDGDERKVPREQVDTLYRKLGTTRQADLLRLLLRPPGVVFDLAARKRAN
jgi:hypothetical protein